MFSVFEMNGPRSRSLTYSVRIVSMPAGTAGESVSITIENEIGTVTLDEAYLYDAPDEPPVLDSVEPAVGPIAGGTEIVIRGSAFSSDATVLIDGVEATEVDRISEERIEATTPAGTAGRVDVTVEQAAGESTIVEGFRYHDAVVRVADASP